MYIDVHCHLDHDMYTTDLDEVIKRAKEKGVVRIITSGIDRNTNQIVLALAKKYDIIRASLGRYPEDALDREGYYKNNPDAPITTVEEECEFIKKHAKECTSIGEIGLDLYTGKDIEKQKSAFRKLIQLSIEINKPIVIHSRKAEKETLEVLNEFRDKLNPKKVVLHCFSGKKALMKEAVERGYNFSIPTNIGRAEHFQGLVNMCPISQLFTETDAPYLSPYKNADGTMNRNEPSYVFETIKIIAKLKNMTEEECKNQLFMNYQKVFGN